MVYGGQIFGRAVLVRINIAYGVDGMGWRKLQMGSAKLSFWHFIGWWSSHLLSVCWGTGEVPHLPGRRGFVEDLGFYIFASLHDDSKQMISHSVSSKRDTFCAPFLLLVFHVGGRIGDCDWINEWKLICGYHIMSEAAGLRLLCWRREQCFCQGGSRQELLGSQVGRRKRNTWRRLTRYVRYPRPFHEASSRTIYAIRLLVSIKRKCCSTKVLWKGDDSYR